MALIKSATMTSASGSVGGVTYSHGKGGMYMRARRVPVNPNTPAQQESRNAFASAAATWRSISEAQRVAWAAYAAATPITNALGDTIHLSGFGQFVASTAFGLLCDESPTSYEDAPLIAGRSAIGNLTVVLDASASTIVVSAIDGSPAHVAVFIGDPQSEGVTFFKGPYQLRGQDNPTAGTLTIATASGRNGLPFVAGQILPVRVRGIGSDGRLTTEWSGLVTVVA